VKRFVDLIDIQKINRMNEVRVIADIVMQKVLLKGKKKKINTRRTDIGPDLHESDIVYK
jgi:hypothetical protein